eukprot:scaffold9009_cov130-Isochrysis_galbana.AAC.14
METCGLSARTTMWPLLTALTATVRNVQMQMGLDKQECVQNFIVAANLRWQNTQEVERDFF